MATNNAPHRPVITDGLATQLVDTDPEETSEWLASFDAAVEGGGAVRARYLMLRLLERARERRVGVPGLRSTDYVNTIGPESEPYYPGDEAVERRIRAAVRWNAAVMVHRAQRPGVGVGGHIATYASSADLYEVAFNHFFRGKGGPGDATGDGLPVQSGDQVFVQGHASPGIYARAFLEGRLTETQLDRFRQEAGNGQGRQEAAGGGLAAYPHPRLMPDFWEFPTVSMGLGPLDAIYQARFNRYLQHRGIKDTSDSTVWAFLGDGEMDEVESLGAIGVAAREELDNLVFVVNCNLQRLDGPVRGNGKIIQELEAYFRGAGWHVIKLIWGRGWDPLLAADPTGALVNRMNTTPDGSFQTYSVESGDYIRQNFFGGDPRLTKLVEHLSDDDIRTLPRGGHDHRKIHAAFTAAVEHKGQPTVVLAHTIKGWQLGADFEGRNSSHQMKHFNATELTTLRDRLRLPIPDSALVDTVLPPYYHPGAGSDEVAYLRSRRRALGGSLPRRVVRSKPLTLPGDAPYAEMDNPYSQMDKGSGKQQVATTMAFVRLLKDLLRDPVIGRRIVPMVPDEARTFGMDSLFPSAKIYSPFGQTYEGVDRALLLAYKEAKDGQILHEGISEAGCLASCIAAGTAYSTHGEPMIPFFVFYSMFGFQRVGDSIWAMADALGRGFLIGATAGRTTLNGEGLQHQDGHSPLLAATNPAVEVWDPAYAYEVGAVVREGLRRMYGPAGPQGRGEDVIYYLTVYNEAYQQPVRPAGLTDADILRGMYVLRAHSGSGRPVQLLSSGVAVPWALAAAAALAEQGVDAQVWSVPSWVTLRREALTNGDASTVARLLDATEGPVVAVTDYMRGVPDQIAPWVDRDRWYSLGTDGFGLSDTRAALREHFHVDPPSIVACALAALGVGAVR